LLDAGNGLQLVAGNLDRKLAQVAVARFGIHRGILRLRARGMGSVQNSSLAYITPASGSKAGGGERSWLETRQRFCSHKNVNDS
jgi:hypothetical protein